MIVNAQIFVANMSRAKQAALFGLSKSELFDMTGFTVKDRWRKDCLVTWAIAVDPAAPDFVGEAFVREDFVEAILDIVDDIK